MTRFARAKGSKASNEKAPEDGTPWEVMKEQLLRAKQETEESKKREQAEKQRIENYEKFLKEQKISKRKAMWCDFPEGDNTKKDDTTPGKKKKKNKDELEMSNSETAQDDNTKKDDTTPGKKKKKNKDKLEMSNSETAQDDDVNKEVVNEKISKKKKKNKQTSNTLRNVVLDTEIYSNEVGVTELQAMNNEQASESNMHEKKKKKKKKQTTGTEDISTLNENIEADQTTVPVQKNNISMGKQNNKKRKPKKLQDGEPVRRKAIDDRSFQLIINGKEVELVRFEGFPIMKKDAERLQELKTSMIKKGIPKSEVQRNIKLERRRAEKALARLKKDVCYNCRRGGHNLSDCPELKTKIPGVDGANDGMCFKCGSIEHRQFECKVQRDKEFRFATCFICKEQGHIARQCPDNPKGLYPNGGCCKLCGDVTHLKKDCPTTKDHKEDSSVKLHTLNDGNIEDIGQKQNTVSTEVTVKKPKKIKF